MATEPIDPDRLPDEIVRLAEPAQDARELPSVQVSTILDAEDIERIQQHAAALDIDMETLLRRFVHVGLAHVEAEVAGEIAPPPRSGPRLRQGLP